jgi:hypothetical protein
LNWVGTKYGIESAMSHKMLILKAFPPENQFHDAPKPQNPSHFQIINKINMVEGKKL